MEKIYENEEFYKLMEKYNFDLPIEVTVVIEDEDPPEPVTSTEVTSDLLILNDTNVQNTNDENKMATKKKKNDIKSIVEETNNPISVNETAFPEERQEDIQDIQWQLLDTVADNLIQITKYHFYTFDSIHGQIENYERLKVKYETFKQHIFYFLYNTTVALLLPRENDVLFINYFLHRVITIAKRNSWFQISYEILNTLINELFLWTKLEKKNLDMKLGPRNHEICCMDWSSRALMISNRLDHSSQVLNIPFENGPITNNTTQFVPKTHLVVQDMNISTNSRPITNCSAEERAGLNISPRINHESQYIFNQTTMSPIKNNVTPNEKNHSEPEVNISPNFIQKTIQPNQKTSNPLNIDRKNYNSTQGVSHLPNNGLRINHSTETMTLNYNNEPETNTSLDNSCQATKTNTSQILLSTGPPNQEIIISVDTKILENINIEKKTKQLDSNAIECQVKESHETKTIKRRKPKESSHHPYSNSNHEANNLKNKNNNGSATTFESSFNEDAKKAENEHKTDTLRSSISRDSGFASPVYGGIRIEQTVETPTSEEQGTPIISHVTSMNPNAVHLNIGLCKVCRATTKNVCTGCYKEYYCSSSCQTKDWDKHKYICRE